MVNPDARFQQLWQVRCWYPPFIFHFEGCVLFFADHVKIYFGVDSCLWKTILLLWLLVQLQLDLFLTGQVLQIKRQDQQLFSYLSKKNKLCSTSTEVHCGSGWQSRWFALYWIRQKICTVWWYYLECQMCMKRRFTSQHECLHKHSILGLSILQSMFAFLWPNLLIGWKFFWSSLK